MIGTNLGPYKILEQVGAGGMGEVWLAEDTRLNRKVAVKVLPAEFATDPERLARFEQEARAAAALNHPHIAVVHDVGSAVPSGTAKPGIGGAGAGPVGEAKETHYIVQEYLEGETLRAPLGKGALPLAKALALAAEIGEALSAAHGAGIIHRDLKPENVFITKDGHAKVLDFGLAKLVEMAPPASPGAAETSAGTAFASPSKSPTMLGTLAGQVMGTAGYMAPEQIRGDGTIDRRADLFSFGCVLYEMVSGRQPFAGKSMLDTLHRIADEDPRSLTELPIRLPAQMHWIINKCLAKEPAKRYQTADDLTVDLKALAAAVESGAAEPRPIGTPEPLDGVFAAAAAGGRRVLSLPMVVAVAALALVAGALATWIGFVPGEAQPAPLQMFQFGLEEGDREVGELAISPDGSLIALIALRDDNDALRLRRIGQVGLSAIPVLENPRFPFFSPDGQSIGFQSGFGALQKVALAGGPPFTLLPGNELSMRAAAWMPDGTIVLAENGLRERRAGLFRIPEAGVDGDPDLLWKPESEGGRYLTPRALPDNSGVLLTTEHADRSRHVALFDFAAGELAELFEGDAPVYAQSGHLLYVRESTLFAVPFDLATHAISGRPAPVLEGVNNESGFAAYAVSDIGTLVWAPGTASSDERPASEYVLVAADGSREVLPIPAGVHERGARLSPDGRRLAAAVRDIEAETTEIYLFDLALGGTGSRLSTAGSATNPVWLPDGEWVYFAVRTDAGQQIYRRRGDFSSAAEPVSEAEARQQPLDAHPNGETLLVRGRGDTSADLLLLSLTDGSLEPLFDSEFNEYDGRFSPDGRYLAYASDESGENAVYVHEMATGRRIKASPGYGTWPAWAPDGGSLYYYARGGPPPAIYAADFDADAFTVTGRREIALLEGENGPADTTEDGRVLLDRRVVPEGGDAVPVINVYLNWFDELNRRVPPGGSR